MNWTDCLLIVSLGAWLFCAGWTMPKLYRGFWLRHWSNNPDHRSEAMFEAVMTGLLFWPFWIWRSEDDIG